jgi:uncharacterized protein (DUF1697 family)
MAAIMASVTTYAALLRGINVGGNKKVPMADLRAVLEGLGYDDVATILQSGNAVFRSRKKVEAVTIERAINARFGFDVAVLLRTADELAGVVAANPFPEALEEPKNLHVWFLSGEPGALDLDADTIAPDQVAAGGRELYVWYANGMAPSKLGRHLHEGTLGLVATARNWNTVTKLVALTATGRDRT